MDNRLFTEGVRGWDDSGVDDYVSLIGEDVVNTCFDTGPGEMGRLVYNLF